MSKLKMLAVCGITLMFTTGCHGLKGHLLGHGCNSCSSCSSSCTVPVYEQTIVCEGCDDDCCEEEAECDGIQSCMNETLRSKLSLDMDQQICFGALQVDMDKLQNLIDDRKEQYEEEQKLYDEYVQAQKEHWKAERERQLRHYIDSLPSQGSSDCCGPKVSCAPPVCPKFELPSPPPRCIVGAAEIPFIVPVTLKVGLDEVGINRPHVRRTVTECYEGVCDKGCFGKSCGNGCCEKGCCDNGGCCDQGGCCTTGAPANGGGYDEAAPPAPAAASHRFPRQR